MLVFGQKEISKKILSIRDRKTRKIRKMKLQELVTEIKEKTRGKPFKLLTLPRFLSRRPQFTTY